jgi:hypothetical protein
MAKKKKKSKSNSVQRDPCITRETKCKQAWCKSKDCGYCSLHCNGDCKKNKAVDAPKGRLALGDIARPPCQPSTCTSNRLLCNSGSGHCERHCKCERCAIERSNKRSVAIPTIVDRPKRPVLGLIYTEVVTDDEEKSANDEKSSDDERIVESVNDLCKAFSLTLTIKNLPSKQKRSESANIIESSLNGKRALETMVNLALQVLEKSVEIIFPGDPDFLLQGVKEKLDAKLPSEASVVKRSEMADKLVTRMVMLLKSLSNGTFGYRVIRAILVESGSHDALVKCFPSHDLPKFGSWARARAKRDFNQMFFNEKEIEFLKRKVARIPDDLIKKAVAHVLSPTMVNTLAWGTKTVKIPGTDHTVTLPKVTRKMTKEDMYRNFRYNQESSMIMEDRILTRAGSGKRIPMIARTNYLAIVDALTHNEEQLTQSIDYVTDALVNETVGRLQKMINDLVAPTIKKELTHLLVLSQNFLKYQYDSHIHDDHDVSYCEDGSFVVYVFQSLLTLCILHCMIALHPQYCVRPHPSIDECTRTKIKRAILQGLFVY